jgi:hypothetical protein
MLAMAERTCPKCRERPSRPTHAYCAPCLAAYVRAHRPRYRDLSEEARKKMNCRSYTNMLIRRGALARGPCEDCGAPNADALHVGYDDPRAVRWRCSTCRMAHLGAS